MVYEGKLIKHIKLSAFYRLIVVPILIIRTNPDYLHFIVAPGVGVIPKSLHVGILANLEVKVLVTDV